MQKYIKTIHLYTRFVSLFHCPVKVLWLNRKMLTNIGSWSYAEIQIWNLTFKTYHFGPPKKCIFGCWRNSPDTFCFFLFQLWFSFKNNNLLSVFLKTHKKSYWLSKTPFWPFLAVNNVFLCIFKNTDQNNICVSIVFKAKTKEKYEEIFFYGFYFKTQKCSFLGVNQFLSFHF